LLCLIVSMAYGQIYYFKFRHYVSVRQGEILSLIFTMWIKTSSVAVEYQGARNDSMLLISPFDFSIHKYYLSVNLLHKGLTDRIKSK